VLRKTRFSLDIKRCFAAEAGYTLIELLIAMTLLGIILAALVSGFTTAIRAETDQTARANDRESAREALERMRQDIHCASAAEAQPTLDSLGNPTGAGYTLQLSVTQGQCSGVTNSSNGVQWCSVSVGGSPIRYQVFRTTSGNCNATDALFQVDYITSYGTITGGNFWSLPACSTGRLQAVSVNLPVNQNPVSEPQATYDLADTIAMRNAPACP
jgi:prepilin-type N-terminal cleavage/methylation domain-containing protein